MSQGAESPDLDNSDVSDFFWTTPSELFDVGVVVASFAELD